MGWGLALLIAVGSLWPTMPDAAGKVSDKLLHFSAYAVLAFTFAGVVERRHWGRVVLGLLAFGGAIELAQAMLSPARSGEWLDMVANTLGVLAGIFTAALFPHSWCRQVEVLAGLHGRPE